MAGSSMIVRAAWLLLGLVPAVAAGSDSTEVGVPVHVGQRVRVIAPSLRPEPVRGRIVAMGEATLVIERDPNTGSGKLEIPRLEIVELQVFAGKKSNWLVGAGVGALFGMAMGVSACDSTWGECTTGDEVEGAAMLGGLGAALGALVGSAFHTDRWRSVDPKGPSVSLTPSLGRRVALTLRVTF